MRWTDEIIKEFGNKLDNISSQIDSLKESYESLKNDYKKETKHIAEVHLKDKSKFIRYSSKASNCSLLRLIKINNLVIGDRINIQWDHYSDPTFVIVNIDNDGRYYLMPTTNLDVVPMHPRNCNWKCTCFEDSYMLKDTLGDFEDYFSIIADIDLEHFEATLASKEEIFDKEKAFPYFKASFKEGKYITEFGKDSTFWLRTRGIPITVDSFAIVDCYGNCDFDDRYGLHGFRPLIILED